MKKFQNFLDHAMPLIFMALAILTALSGQYIEALMWLAMSFSDLVITAQKKQIDMLKKELNK